MRLFHISSSICAHDGWSSPSEPSAPEPPADAGLNPLRMPLPDKGQALRSGAGKAADGWALSVGQTLGEMLAGEKGCDVNSE